MPWSETHLRSAGEGLAPVTLLQGRGPAHQGPTSPAQLTHVQSIHGPHPRKCMWQVHTPHSAPAPTPSHLPCPILTPPSQAPLPVTPATVPAPPLLPTGPEHVTPDADRSGSTSNYTTHSRFSSPPLPLSGHLPRPPTSHNSHSSCPLLNPVTGVGPQHVPHLFWTGRHRHSRGGHTLVRQIPQRCGEQGGCHTSGPCATTRGTCSTRLFAVVCRRATPHCLSRPGGCRTSA